MNLEESDVFREKLEKETRNKRSVMLGIVLCAVLIALMTILIMIISYQDSITEKLFIDDKKVSLSSSFYFVEDDVTYINLKQVAELFGYTYTKGEYNVFDVDEEKGCHLKNDFEIVSVSLDSSRYKKYLELIGKNEIAGIEVTLKTKNGYKESFELKNPLKAKDGIIYASLEDTKKMLNLSVDWQEYKHYLYSLEYAVKQAKNSLGNLGYKEMSGYYENIRAIADGYAIVGNGQESSNKLYGVYSLRNKKEVISVKYNDLRYAQNLEQFYVTVSNGTMGILAGDGSTVIAPSEFQNIELLDDVKQLYVVEKDNEYGVVDKSGKKIIYAENDYIGYDVSRYVIDKIENGRFLFDKFIPVEKNDKYGLYNVDGDVKLSLVYDGLGYVSTASSTTAGNEESILILPKESVGVNGIIINFNDLYGIFDVDSESLLVPCVMQKIYAIRKSGEITYYIEYNGETYNLADYLIENGIVTVDSKNDSQKNSYAEQNNYQGKENVDYEEVSLETERSNEDDSNEQEDEEESKQSIQLHESSLENTSSEENNQSEEQSSEEEN